MEILTYVFSRPIQIYNHCDLFHYAPSFSFPNTYVHAYHPSTKQKASSPKRFSNAQLPIRIESHLQKLHSLSIHSFPARRSLYVHVALERIEPLRPAQPRRGRRPPAQRLQDARETDGKGRKVYVDEGHCVAQKERPLLVSGEHEVLDCVLEALNVLRSQGRIGAAEEAVECWGEAGVYLRSDTLC